MSLEVLFREFGLAFRNVARHRRRVFFALTIIAGGVITFLLAGGFIQSILIGMRESTIHSQLGHIQVVRPNYFETGIADPFSYLLPKNSPVEDLIRQQSNVIVLTPRLSFTGLASIGEATISFVGDGVSPQGELELSSEIRIAEGLPLNEEATNGIILGQGLAANLGARVGDKMVLMTNTAKGGLNASDVVVRGIFISTVKAYDDTALRVPIKLARKLVKVEGATSWVVLLSDTQQTIPVLNALKGQLDPKDFQLVPWNELADFYNKTVILFLRQVSLVKLLIGLIIVLSITNTLSMAVRERTSEIGTAMALGVRRSGILRVFVLEGLILGLAGGAIGVLLGWSLSLLISAIGIPMPPPPGMAQGFDAKIIVNYSLALDGWMLALGATLLASLFPAWQASRMVIVDALRQQR